MDRQKERMDCPMMKKRKSRLWNYMSIPAAVLSAAVFLTACQSGKYERIELTGGVQQAADSGHDHEAESGQTGGGSGEGIVIEQETEVVENADAEAAEAAGDAEAPAEAGADEITLLFGGDVLLSNHVLNAYQKGGGIHGVVDEGYRSLIQNADFFMVNEEFPFSTRGVQAEDKEYTFRLEPERVSMFQEMGIDAVTLANNHALDFGVDALLDTCDTLDGAGILHTGAGANLQEARKPVDVELQGKQIAIIGATRVIPVSSWAAGKNHPGMLSSYDATALLEEIRAQKEAGKFVIVYVHWGVERDEKPQDYQRSLGQQYIDAGADLVIGSHPHVLQGIEYYKGKPIVYSLGNFVFGSSIPRTMLLEVTLPAADPANLSDLADEAASEQVSKEAPEPQITPRLRLIPGTSGAGYTRMLTDAGDIQEFRQYMESISFGITVQEDGTVH